MNDVAVCSNWIFLIFFTRQPWKLELGENVWEVFSSQIFHEVFWEAHLERVGIGLKKNG